MTEHEASRTLVKSPPELWAECSQAESLGRHLGEFGDIRITRLEPESTVAWEGTLASGTVRLEPSGWGTRVILTAEAAAGSEAVPELDPASVPEPEAAVTGSELAVPEPEPAVPEPEPAVPEPEPVACEPVAPALAPPQPRRRSGGLLHRLLALFRSPQPVATPEPVVSVPEPAPAAAEPEPVVSVPEPAPAVSVPELELEPGVMSVPDPEPAGPGPGRIAVPELDPDAILIAALDSLGQAHHRPFSRG